MVRAGDVIAEMVDPLADDPRQARVPVRCEASGPILSIRAMKSVGAGDSIAMVIGDEKLAHPDGLLLSD